METSALSTCGANDAMITTLHDPVLPPLIDLHGFIYLQPKVVTDIEDEELKRQMEELQLANQEVAGDDDTSDQEVGDMEEES